MDKEMEELFNETIIEIIDTYGFPPVIDELNISHYDKLQLLKERIKTYLYESLEKEIRIEWWRLVFENGQMFLDGKLVFVL